MKLLEDECCKKRVVMSTMFSLYTSFSQRSTLDIAGEGALRKLGSLAEIIFVAKHHNGSYELSCVRYHTIGSSVSVTLQFSI